MNRIIKDATVRRYYYGSHDQIRRRLDDFLSAYDFGRRLKTLKGLIPYEAICRVWQTEPHELAPPNTGTKHLALVTTAATGHQAPAQTSQGPAVSGVLQCRVGPAEHGSEEAAEIPVGLRAHGVVATDRAGVGRHAQQKQGPPHDRAGHHPTEAHSAVHAADIRDRGVMLMASLFGLCPFLLKLYADGGY